MDKTPFYSCPLSSLRDVDRLLVTQPQASGFVDLFLSIFHTAHHRIDEYHTKAQELLKTAFCGSWGFKGHEGVKSIIIHYKEQLDGCFVECSTLDDLILKALQSHHIALAHFTKTERDIESATAAIKETEILANHLAEVFARFQDSFFSLSDLISKVGAALVLELHLIKLPPTSEDEIDPSSLFLDENKLQKLRIASLYASSQAISAINFLVLDIGTYFGNTSRICSQLSPSCLSSAAIVEALMQEYCPNDTDEHLGENEYKDLKNFVACSELARQFETSYVKWLSIAVVHQIGIRTLINCISALDQLNYDLERIKKDPLAVLHPHI